MDDFGNCYQTDAWAYGCEQWAYSVATFGWLDDDQLDESLRLGIHFSKWDI